PPELADHPPTLYVAESAILAHLDPWIETLAEPTWLADSQRESPAAAAGRPGLQAQLGELNRRIANLLDAIESGGDPKLLLDQLTRRTAEREAVKARIARAIAPTILDAEQIAAIVAELGGIASILRNAT